MASHRATGSAARPRRARTSGTAGTRRHRAPRPGTLALTVHGSSEWSSFLPRAAVVGALGVALVAPLVGPHLVTDSARAATGLGAPRSAPPVERSRTSPAPAFTMDLDLVRAGVPAGATGAAAIAPGGTAGTAPASGPPVAAVSVPQAAPLPAEQLLALRADAEQASRTVERARLDGCSGIAPATQPANGQIDPSELCTLWDGKEMLRADAAVALAALNATYFLRFGADLCLTDGYRSYGEQVAVRRQKPGLAAVPGTSQHGWGLAVDVCGLTGYGGDVYPWLRENAPAFGWDNPDWARDGGSGPNEPWHWEYVAGQPAQPVADS